MFVVEWAVGIVVGGWYLSMGCIADRLSRLKSNLCITGHYQVRVGGRGGIQADSARLRLGLPTVLGAGPRYNRLVLPGSEAAGSGTTCRPS